ncbi:MAG: neutral/alkaline non-lysosomal ceramidase N-terminal domain-containing protein [Planctomycetaceae bacterium]
MTQVLNRRLLLQTLAASAVLPSAVSHAGSAAATAHPDSWQAGVSREIITPDTAVWLAGYGSRRAPEGKLHDLWMKALALQAPDGAKAILITSDFQGVPASMSNRVFEKLAELHGLSRDQIMFTFSHNHCGPRLGDDLIDYYPVENQQEELVKQYTDLMVERTVRLCTNALSNLSDARLGHGIGQTTFAVNRRNNREADIPDLLARGIPLAGPVDHSVPVLQVTRPDGTVAAILFGYACHPTTLSFTKWCGDYPGFAQLQLEQAFPGAAAMFVNTCGGDQNPLPRRTVELCEKYGSMLADAVKQTLLQPLIPVSPQLRTAFEMIELPYLNVITRDELLQAAAADQGIRGRWARRMLTKLDAGQHFAAASPYPLHVWLLGAELKWIGMGAETVVDYAIRFKQEHGAGTWVMGYADDMLAYIPSRRVWEEGGYEGGSNLYEYGRPALRWNGDIENRIVAGVDRLFLKVGQK